MAHSPVVVAYLLDVEDELRAVEQLLTPETSRFAAYHLQQAAEKLAKAVRLARGLPATKEHRLAVLLADLPMGDPWRDLLGPLEVLSAYATAYRYPTPTGHRKRAPPAAEVREFSGRLRALLAKAREEWAP